MTLEEMMEMLDRLAFHAPLLEVRTIIASLVGSMKLGDMEGIMNLHGVAVDNARKGLVMAKSQMVLNGTVAPWESEP